MTLYPQGGGFLKNKIAKAMVAYGQRNVDEQADLSLINQRVPAPKEIAGPYYNDSFVFQGASHDGSLFMSRLGFRENGETEPWIFLELQGKKYVNENIEVTLENDDQETIASAGLQYRYAEATDSWRITFDGELLSEEGTVAASVDLQYKATSAMYLSSVHMDPASTGRAMAEMPWSKDYFDKLRSERQVRVEQGALLTGIATINGESHTLNLRAFRDHSWGKRNWTFINRYIWNIFSLNEPLMVAGEPCEYLCFTTVDYGTSFKHLVSGWIAGPSTVFPIVASSNMHELAVDGEIPNEYSVVFQPKGSEPVTARVLRSTHSHSWMMQRGDSNIGDFEVNEAFCHVEIDGKKGQGMSEFGFSRNCGIPRPVWRRDR